MPSAAPPAPLQLASATQRLGNGMRVVAHPDHSAPLVAVHLMLRAGSRDETPGRSGLAHLLEHLTFEGTEHAPKGAFDDLLEGVGGSSNGSTWLDRTNYYETVPSHAVELALWLERERLAHWLPGLDGRMLETQRGVVLNERLQTVDNRPYGAADERLMELLFPPRHPYGWPVIGWRAELEQITLRDTANFFSRFYAPERATLVLAGDIEPERAWELAERYFGDLPAGPAGVEAPETPTPPGISGTGRATLADAVSFPRVHRAWAVPPYGTPEWVALDVLAYLLADGESSRLQRALLRDAPLAQEVDTWLYPTALHGVWGWTATARAGVPPERLEERVAAVLREVAEAGVSEAEVAAAVRRVRRDTVAELAMLENRAEALAYAATVLGEADAVNRVLAAYGDISAGEVQRLAAEQLRPDRGVTVTVVPEEDG